MVMRIIWSGALLLVAGSQYAQASVGPTGGKVVDIEQVQKPNRAILSTFFIPLDDKTTAKAESDFGISAGEVATAVEDLSADINSKTVKINQLFLASSSDDTPVVIVDEVSGEIVDCKNTLVLAETDSYYRIPPYDMIPDPVVVKDCKKATSRSDIVVFGAKQADSIVNVKSFITTSGFKPRITKNLYLNTISKELATSTVNLKASSDEKDAELKSDVTAQGDNVEIEKEAEVDVSEDGATVVSSTKVVAKSNNQSDRPVEVETQEIKKGNKKSIEEQIQEAINRFKRRNRNRNRKLM